MTPGKGLEPPAPLVWRNSPSCAAGHLGKPAAAPGSCRELQRCHGGWLCHRWHHCSHRGRSRRELTRSTGSAASPRCCFNHRSTFPWHPSAQGTAQLQHIKFGEKQARSQSCSSRTGCSQPSVQPGLELPSRKLCLSQNEPRLQGGWKGALSSSNPPSNHSPSTAKPSTEPCPQTPQPHLSRSLQGWGFHLCWAGQPFW